MIFLKATLIKVSTSFIDILEQWSANMIIAWVVCCRVHKLENIKCFTDYLATVNIIYFGRQMNEFFYVQTPSVKWTTLVEFL